MKYLMLTLLIFAGCATAKPTEYNIGCKDGIRVFVEEVVKTGIDESLLERGCNNIETVHNKTHELVHGEK